MTKAKETRATYTAESITTVTARGQTEIPRALRERYGVKAKSRLRWKDTGKGLLVIPIDQTASTKDAKLRTHRGNKVENLRPQNREAIKFLREWMLQPDDWTPEQWDDFEQELRANRLRFRDVEL